MKSTAIRPLVLMLLVLSPLGVPAAPPPYWPPYPPSPYYPYPPVSPPAETPQVAASDALPQQGQDEEAPATAQGEGKEASGEPPTTSAATAESAAQSDDEWELGREVSSAIQQGNFAEAYYLWRPRAEAGDADAQYGIGWMYHNGYGLAINDEEASAWWKLASRQGHTDATFALGMLYGLGEGAVKRDMERAVEYYHRAARDGHEDARLLLRTLMAEGDKSARALMQALLDEGRVAEVTPPAMVLADRANVRKGPGTRHKVVATLKQGHALMPLRRKGRWLLVGIKGKPFTGWIHDSLVGREFLTSPVN